MENKNANQETATVGNMVLGDVPFTDADGNPIFLGSIIEQTNFNGEQYLAKYKVVIDPADNEVCLLMISGNERAMQPGNHAYKYTAFPTVINGRLLKGRVIGHYAQHICLRNIIGLSC